MKYSVCVCVGVCTSYRVSNKQTDEANGQINEVAGWQAVLTFSPFQISERWFVETWRRHGLMCSDIVIVFRWLMRTQTSPALSWRTVSRFLFRSVPDSRQRWWMSGFRLTNWSQTDFTGFPESNLAVQIRIFVPLTCSDGGWSSRIMCPISFLMDCSTH